MGVLPDRIFWDADYSTKFLCLHKAEHVNVSKNEIADISIKRAYARNFLITCIVVFLMILYLAADITIFALSQGEREWLLTGVGILFGGCAVSVLWYLVSRINVLQVTTTDKKCYRVPFFIKKPKKKQADVIKENLLNDLRNLGLR